jgi:voltage-gated potassium channel
VIRLAANGNPAFWSLASRIAGQPALRRVATGMRFTLLVVACSVLAYMLAGWSFADAIYMVVITIFGIGYGEVQPIVGWPLRTITMLTILFGYASVAYTLSGFVQWLIDGELRQLLGLQKMEQKISQLRQHVILCGFGRMGQTLATSLHAGGKTMVVIDRDPNRIAAASAMGFATVQGNAAEEEVLRRAGIDHAATLASVLSDDAANVFLTITAHDLNPGLEILARAEQTTTVRKLVQVGATHVISPTQIGAEKLAQLILRPNDDTRLKHSLLSEWRSIDWHALDLQIDELRIESLTEEGSTTIGQLLTGHHHGTLVLAVLGRDQTILLRPPGSHRIEIGEVLVLVGHPDDLESISQRCRSCSDS